jgi:hypothetical protein
VNDQHVSRSLVDILVATRQAERDLFGSLDPARRDSPLRDGDWSPKDHQAHLTAWKARQADRLAAARAGDELPPAVPDTETDAVNAELQATRADWTWEAIENEADTVSRRLADELAATGSDDLLANPHLVDGTFGNGAFHAQQHFSWLLAADIGLDADRVLRFGDDIERMVRSSGLPDRDQATAIYNTACFMAVIGHPDQARPRLRDAFALRPELVEWARQDGDLVSLRDEIDALAAQ